MILKLYIENLELVSVVGNFEELYRWWDKIEFLDLLVYSFDDKDFREVFENYGVYF